MAIRHRRLHLARSNFPGGVVRVAKQPAIVGERARFMTIGISRGRQRPRSVRLAERLAVPDAEPSPDMFRIAQVLIASDMLLACSQTLIAFKKHTKPGGYWRRIRGDQIVQQWALLNCSTASHLRQAAVSASSPRPRVHPGLRSEFKARIAFA